MIASRAKVWMRGVNFLNRRAKQAGVLRNIPLQHRGAEIDVAEHAVARIGIGVVGGSAEHRRGHRPELLDGGYAEPLLAFEMVEEGALGQARRSTYVVHRGGRVTLRANDITGGIEQP